MKTLLIIFTTLSFILISLGILLERKDWNKGKCPECGRDWTYFDSDSQGGRGYWCLDCKRAIWISYPLIDRKKER